MEILLTLLLPRNKIIIVTFHPNGCSQFENPEAPDFKKNASASSFRVRFRFRPLFIKVLLLLQKINRFHRFRFRILGTKQ